MINKSLISIAESILKTKMSEDNFKGIYMEKMECLITSNEKNKKSLEIVKLKIELWTIDIKFINIITKILQGKDSDYKKVLLDFKQEFETIIPKLENIEEARVKANSSLQYINQFLKNLS